MSFFILKYDCISLIKGEKSHSHTKTCALILFGSLFINYLIEEWSIRWLVFYGNFYLFIFFVRKEIGYELVC